MTRSQESWKIFKTPPAPQPHPNTTNPQKTQTNITIYHEELSCAETSLTRPNSVHQPEISHIHLSPFKMSIPPKKSGGCFLDKIWSTRLKQLQQQQDLRVCRQSTVSISSSNNKIAAPLCRGGGASAVKWVWQEKGRPLDLER